MMISFFSLGCLWILAWNLSDFPHFLLSALSFDEENFSNCVQDVGRKECENGRATKHDNWLFIKYHLESCDGTILKDTSSFDFIGVEYVLRIHFS